MSRMTYTDWRVYAAIRNSAGKQAAEDYRHIRNLKHRSYCTGTQPIETDWICLSTDDEYGYIKKRFVPFHFDEEQKQIFADANWIYCPYTMYDCTGKPFTRSIDFHEIPGGTWIYHFIGIDI